MSDLDVARVARLARLELTAEEMAAFDADATRVLEAFGGLPDSEAEPSSDDESLLRDDSVLPPSKATRDGIVALFPRRDGDLARVPRGLTDE